MNFKRTDENYIYEVVSRNIKAQRINKGLTQQELANLINYSKQFISNIESKRNFQTFSLGTVWTIAQKLDLEMDTLFKESPVEEKIEKIKEGKTK